MTVEREPCVRCGVSPEQAAVVLSSKSGFKRWVCASSAACANRRSVAKKVAEAEARGYQRAIDTLREADRFLKFSETHPLVEHVNPFGANDMAADYLEASAQTAIRSGESTDEQ